MSEAADSVPTTQCAKRERWGLWRCGLKPGRVCAAPPFFSTRCLEDTGVLMVFAIPPTRFSLREREGRKLRVMVVEERHRKRRRERMVHSSAVCWCVPTSTHTVDVPCLTHRGKTRQDMGMVTHTHMGMDETTGHDTQGGGKGREKTRGGSSQDTHHYTKEKEKGKKTMTKPKDNEER